MNKHFGILELLACVVCVSSTYAAPPSNKNEDTLLNTLYAQIQLVDKVTGRFQVLNAKIGESLQYQNLKIHVAVCRQSAEFEMPDSKAFITVWEYPKEELPQKLFAGWMLASSPALSTLINHPRYNVWLIKCSNKAKIIPKLAD